MGITVTGLDELKFILEKLGKSAPSNTLAAMKKEALKIQSLAVKMAPVDDGDLEKAIKVSTEGGGRDGLGRFASKSVTIYVDSDMPDTSRPGKSVGDYAYEMHEHLTPFGSLKLGPKSVSKQSGQSELVGGGYLERAADEVEEGIAKRLSKAAKADINS